ncbi:MAG: CopD family protein [Achromobacter sp.]|nr:CopD family protein [Achromobacter sp.]
MTYQLLKMLHVAAVVAWLGGSLFVSLFLLSSQPPDSDEAPKERKMLGALRRWTLLVTTPAMVLAWLVGLHLAVTFGWFAMTWIWIKIALALVQSGRRAERRHAPPVPGQRQARAAGRPVRAAHGGRGGGHRDAGGGQAVLRHGARHWRRAPPLMRRRHIQTPL